MAKLYIFWRTGFFHCDPESITDKMAKSHIWGVGFSDCDPESRIAKMAKSHIFEGESAFDSDSEAKTAKMTKSRSLLGEGGGGFFDCAPELKTGKMSHFLERGCSFRDNFCCIQTRQSVPFQVLLVHFKWSFHTLCVLDNIRRHNCNRGGLPLVLKVLLYPPRGDLKVYQFLSSFCSNSTLACFYT